MVSVVNKSCSGSSGCPICIRGQKVWPPGAWRCQQTGQEEEQELLPSADHTGGAVSVREGLQEVLLPASTSRPALLWFQETGPLLEAAAEGPGLLLVHDEDSCPLFKCVLTHKSHRFFQSKSEH